MRWRLRQDSHSRCDSARGKVTLSIGSRVWPMERIEYPRCNEPLSELYVRLTMPRYLSSRVDHDTSWETLLAAAFARYRIIIFIIQFSLSISNLKVILSFGLSQSNFPISLPPFSILSPTSHKHNQHSSIRSRRSNDIFIRRIIHPKRQYQCNTQRERTRRPQLVRISMLALPLLIIQSRRREYIQD
jgi:hypothetical protein